MANVEIKIKCLVHGEQSTKLVAVKGVGTRRECVKCIEVAEGMKYEPVNIGPLGLRTPKDHEGQYVYGQD